MVTEHGVKIDSMLTMNATAQLVDQNLYVATKAVPTVKTPTIDSTIKNWKLEDLKKYNVELRKPGAKYKELEMDLEEQTIRTEFYGLKYKIAEEYTEEMPNLKAGQAYKAMDDSFRTRELVLEEVALASGAYDLSDITTLDLTSTTVDPITVIRAGKTAVKNAGLMFPNAILMTEDVFNAFLANSFIEEKLSYNGVGGSDLRMITSENQLAQILGVKYLHVLKHPFATKTQSLLLYYIDEVAPKDKPNTLLTVARNYASAVNDAAGIGVTKEYFDEDDDCFKLKSKNAFKTIIKTKSLGLLYRSITVA